MFVVYLKLKNWRNFREANIRLARRSYFLGPNASGKSNLLDVFRFLRDVSKRSGGGLQKAVADRGGIKRLRCLHARQDPEVRIEVGLANNAEDSTPAWRYVLGFKPEGKGAQRLLVSTEQVWFGEEKIIDRPDKNDRNDLELLTETHLEATRTNAEFRDIASYFSEITYLHVVPQLLKFGDRFSANPLEHDPFGQGLLESVAACTKRIRDSRLKKINEALTVAVPQFRELRFVKDEESGKPHLEALYEHYRPRAGWQREDQFSDGTLRLFGLLWSLLDTSSLLLLEEPELSLNESIVREVPLLIDRVQRSLRVRRQVLISTHSEALLQNKGIDPAGVVILEPTVEGTVARHINQTESVALEHGLSIADVVLPKTNPKGAEQMGLWD